MPDGADYWEQQAASFDDAPDHGLRDPAVRGAWRSLLMPQLPPAPARVADLGCGTGSLAVLLADVGYTVSGIDLSAGMIKRARDKAAAEGLTVDFAVGDASRPLWADNSFDVVLCRHVLWALEDHSAALQEWVRILRRSGRLILIEGRWGTGAGLPAAAVLELLTAVDRSATVLRLDDPRLWGMEITDERYLVLSPAAPPA
jgi:SAM-dependent methyltransferase